MGNIAQGNTEIDVADSVQFITDVIKVNFSDDFRCVAVNICMSVDYTVLGDRDTLRAIERPMSSSRLLKSDDDERLTK